MHGSDATSKITVTIATCTYIFAQDKAEDPFAAISMADEMFEDDDETLAIGGEAASSNTGLPMPRFKKEQMLESLDRNKLMDTMQKGLATMRNGFQKAKKALQLQDEFPDGSVMSNTLRDLASATMTVQSFMQSGEYAVTWNRWADSKPVDDTSLRAWCDDASMHTARMADLLKCTRTLQPKATN
jgi:hypothetical protein